MRIILVIAALVQFIEMFLQKAMPALYQALGIYLPLITTNCAVLGVALLNTQNGYNFIESVVYGITGGLGFTAGHCPVCLASGSGLDSSSDCPKCFEGFPHRADGRRSDCAGIYGLPGSEGLLRRRQR